MKTKLISLFITLMAAMAINATDYYFAGEANGWSNNNADWKFVDVNGVLTLEVADLYGDFKIVENGAWFPQHGAAAKGEGVALNGSYVLVKDIDGTHEPASCTILIPANQGEGDWRYKDAKLTLDASDPDHLVISLVAGTLYDHSAVPISYYLVGACTNNWSLADAVEFVDVNGVLTATVADLNGTFKIIKDRKWGTEYALNDAGVVMGEDYTLQLGGGNIALANPFAGYRNAVLTLTINGNDHILKLVSGTYYITQDDWFIPSSLLGWNCNDATKFDAVEGQANTYEKFFTTFSGEFKIVYGQWLVEFGAPKGKTGNWSVDTPIQLAYPCDNMKPEDPEAVYQNVTVTIVVNYETASAVLTIYTAPISGRRKIGELYYNLNGRELTAKVTYQSINSQNYSGLTSLDIPASVTCNSQTYSVTSICDSAFYSCKSLTSVTIPNSVTSIGTQAFINCSGITAVHISDIAAWCAIEFSSASSFPLAYTKSGHLYLNDIEVTNLVIPNSVTSIGSYTFYKCSGLTSVTIPNSVTSIGSDAFGSCSGLTAVHISDIAAWCAIEFGSSGSNPLASAKHLYLNNAEITNLIIPNSATSIGNYAFYACSGLTSVTIPNSVTSIGNNAFFLCSGLTAVYINDIAAWCAIEFGSTGASNPLFYAKHLYLNYAEITNLVIPNSVTSIGNYAFYNCSGLTTVTISTSVTTIGNGAFSGCSGFTSITIPNSVTSIGGSAFSNCSGLTSITIPNSVTSIGGSAFSNCSGLTSITIPNSVTSIGGSAFYKCSGLTHATILAETPPTVGTSTFPTNIPIYVPCGTLEAYKMATNWDKYKLEYQNTATLALEVANKIGGSVTTNREYDCVVDATITATPDYGYHFVQWTDGNTNNPRDIVITQDTTFVAQFAKNTYCISLQPDQAEHGSVSGAGTFDYLDSKQIAAQANYGYRFTQWSDGVADNPRTIVLTQDTSFVAQFAKNTYTISLQPDMAEHGSVSGAGTFEYLDNKQIAAQANYGYHFTQWSDGVADNPRTIVLTQDTTFVAQFAKNTYTISLQPDQAEHGSVSGAGTFEYLDNKQIGAQANYGYHFTQWSDGVPDNPRTIVLTQDTAFVAQFAKNTYTISLQPDMAEHGSVSGAGTFEYLDNKQIAAQANYGYHFTQWSDGVADNPRTIVLTQDTSFVAQFAPNKYSLSATCDTTFGYVIAENGEHDYLTELTLSVREKYGYQFARWSDGNRDNPRTITLTENTELTAIFAPRKFTISDNSDPTQGHITNTGEFDYLSLVSLEATPNYGYHFTAWSDGVVNNPRVITLVGDTTFTALFDVDKSGTCGDNNALTWTYNDDGQLTISGNGALNSNYTFGVEAPVSMRKLIIESGVSSVGNAAFKNQTTLNEITISHGVNTIKAEAFAGCTEVSVLTLGANLQSIGANAFDGCKRVEEITVYAERVIDISATTFANIGNKKYVYVYVPEGSLRKYERDEYWSEFDLHVIGATGTTVEDNQISVATTSNTADVTWPAVTNAVTYELAIKDRDGNAICTLIFNAQGQLTSIAFAAPGRPQQVAQTTGFTFTVTGLDSGSKYGFTIDAKDENGVVLDHKSGSFETTSSIATGIDNQETDIAPVKVLRNGEVLILRDGKIYTVQGQEVR